MKKISFDGFKNLSTPEEWKEKAFNIPKKKKVVPFYKRPSLLATVASVIFASATSLAIIANIGTESVIPVAPPLSTTTSVFGREDDTLSRNNNNHNNNLLPPSVSNDNINNDLVNNNQFKGIIPDVFTNHTPGQSSDNTQTNTAGGFVLPYPTIQTSNSGSSTTNTIPNSSSTNPTQQVVTDPPEHTIPHTKPTEPLETHPVVTTVPTQKPTVKPTEEPPIVEPTTEEPTTQGGGHYESHPPVTVHEPISIICDFYLSNTHLNVKGSVYCHLINLDTSKAVYPMYSSSEICRLQKASFIADEYYAYYDIEQTELTSGNYLIMILDSNGRSFSATRYIDASKNNGPRIFIDATGN